MQYKYSAHLDAVCLVWSLKVLGCMCTTDENPHFKVTLANQNVRLTKNIYIHMYVYMYTHGCMYIFDFREFVGSAHFG